MLAKIIKYLQGYVRLKVEGASQERLLNLFNVYGFSVWRIEKNNDFLKLNLKVNDYKKIRPLIRKTGTKITILEKIGLPFVLFRFRKRKLFIFGMVFCISCLYTLSLFVWNIHFEGNITQNNAELIAYLDTLGVKHGVLKSNIECEKIETYLREKYPNILWVSVELKGTRILVQIKENTDRDIVTMIEGKDSAPYSISANSSGVISSMVVRQGTPMVAVGDSVEKGQVLVAGYYEIKDDTGALIRYQEVSADADIQILTVEDYTDQFSIVYEEKKYTEKKRLGFKINLFQKTFDFIPPIHFEKYDLIDQNHEFRITENFYLPFSIKSLWYLEFETETKEYTPNEMEIIAENRLYKKYKNILQKGVQITEKDVKIDTNGKLCHVKGKVKLLIPEMQKIPVVLPAVKKDAS